MNKKKAKWKARALLAEQELAQLRQRVQQLERLRQPVAALLVASAIHATAMQELGQVMESLKT